MKPFQNLESKIIPIPIKDVDTDMIIPAQYMTNTTTDLDFWGQHLFQRLRDSDPSFPLNLEKYQEAKVIVSKTNFGSGSSREHAVWSLLGWGIKVVIAPDFADIFKSNSGKNGLLLIELGEKTINKILTKAETEEVVLGVNLETQIVNFENEDYRFDFDPFRKDCLLKGVDDLEYILMHEEEIEIWNTNRKSNLFIS